MSLEKRAAIQLSHFLVFSLVILLITLFMSMSAKDFGLGGEVQDLNDGWTVTFSDTVLSDAQIPLNLDIPPNTPYTITREGITSGLSGSVLKLRASMMSVSVFSDGKEIYSNDIQSRSTWFYDPYPSVWHFIHLPSCFKDHTLSITFSSPVEEFSGMVNSISFGTGEALLIESLSDRFLDFIISFFLIVIGMIFIFITPLTRKINADARLLYLGEFAVIIGVWLLSETRILQIFTGNRFFIGSLGYLAVTCIPIPLLLYIRPIVRKKIRPILSGFIALFSIELFMILILQLSGTLFFIQSARISMILIIVCALTLIGILLDESFRRTNREARRFLNYFVILVCFTAIEIVFFFLQKYDFQSSFISIGIMFFYLLLAADSISYINDLIIKNNETLFYQRLAYRDSLTGGLNRTAFDRDLEAFMNENSIDGFRLILFDLNDLKKINDNYGHIAGDNALATVYKALEDSYGKTGRCYRISGDEFAVLLRDNREELYENSSAQFEKELVKESDTLPEQLKVAAGTGVYRASDEVGFDEFYHIVDQRMYENKRFIKDQE